MTERGQIMELGGISRRSRNSLQKDEVSQDSKSVKAVENGKKRFPPQSTREPGGVSKSNFVGK